MSFGNYHDFYRLSKHERAKPGHSVWRCDKCDSEVMFTNKRSARDVNQIMSMKMACIPKEHITE